MNLLLRSPSQILNPLARGRRFGFGSGVQGGAFVGPLDAYTADLKLALLPFRGFSSYTGSLFRVRDTNDDSEQAVNANANGSLAFPSVVGNAAVRWWYDQSGQGNHLPQSSASAQPYLLDNIQGGKAVVRFDGTSDTAQGSDSTSGNRTVYMVCRFRTGTANARAWKDSLGGGNADVYYNGGQFYYYLTSPNVVDPVGASATSWSLVTLRYSGGNTCEPWRNNTSSPSFGTTGFANPSYYGYVLASDGSGGNFGAVDIAARLTYAAAHDTTTRQAIQTILAAQFGITLA